MINQRKKYFKSSIIKIVDHLKSIDTWILRLAKIGIITVWMPFLLFMLNIFVFDQSNLIFYISIGGMLLVGSIIFPIPFVLVYRQMYSLYKSKYILTHDKKKSVLFSLFSNPYNKDNLSELKEFVVDHFDDEEFINYYLDNIEARHMRIYATSTFFISIIAVILLLIQVLSN